MNSEEPSSQDEPSDVEPEGDPPGTGIFIGRGMRVVIPAGGLVFEGGPDGTISGKATLHVLYDVCPLWLEIGLRDLVRAEAAWKEVQDRWGKSEQPDGAMSSLESECAASMQVIMSSAVAIDAFYAVAKDRIVLPEGLSETWRKNKTARYAQVAEVMRQSFKIGPKSTQLITQVIKDIFGFRDRAVHPSGTHAQAALHPELNVGMEWRFVTFHVANARAILNASISLLSQLVFRPNEKFAQLVTYCRESEARFCRILADAEQVYGKLFERARNEPGPPYPAA